MALVTLLAFERRSEATGTYEVTLRLLDANDEPVPVLEDGEPLVIRAHAEVKDRDSMAHDAPATASLVVNLGPGVPLEPNRRYRWQVSVNGKTHPDWSAPFYGRAAEDRPREEG
ncbi:hypothetical protein [Amycolatopsis sp. NPDC006125]|uniref:hypothetical protein n=1 Tax=Amycolatopsis sp. NPDC006125 TaxID=3156730 RepID=UPI0033B301A4